MSEPIDTTRVRLLYVPEDGPSVIGRLCDEIDRLREELVETRRHAALNQVLVSVTIDLPLMALAEQPNE
jgi:hypothetical protein